MRRHHVRPSVSSSPQRHVTDDSSGSDTMTRGKYYRLQQTDTRRDDGFEDEQFIDPCLHTRRLPWRAITLATLLSVMGTMMLTVGILLITGYLDEKYSDRTWPVLLLGGLMFIPGAYHVRIAYYAYTGQTGYSFDDIPDFD